MVLDQGTHRKSSSYGLSGYRGFTGLGSQDRCDNKSFRFSSIVPAFENHDNRSACEDSCVRKGISLRTFVDS